MQFRTLINFYKKLALFLVFFFIVVTMLVKANTTVDDVKTTTNTTFDDVKTAIDTVQSTFASAKSITESIHPTLVFTLLHIFQAQDIVNKQDLSKYLDKLIKHTSDLKAEDIDKKYWNQFVEYMDIMDNIVKRSDFQQPTAGNANTTTSRNISLDDIKTAIDTFKSTFPSSAKIAEVKHLNVT